MSKDQHKELVNTLIACAVLAVVVVGILASLGGR